MSSYLKRAATKKSKIHSFFSFTNLKREEKTTEASLCALTWLLWRLWLSFYDYLKYENLAFYAFSGARIHILFSLVFKVALDPCYNYVCIYFKSMHELRRLKPTTIEMFMRIYFLKFFV